MRSGTTLLELVFVLALMALALAWVLPGLASRRDRLAVRSARESLVALVVEARAGALTYGGADLTLVTEPAGARLRAGGELRDSLDLAAVGVRMSLSGGRPVAVLHFDALGLGELAGRSVRLTLGTAEAGLVVSAYGRVRRW